MSQTTPLSPQSDAIPKHIPIDTIAARWTARPVTAHRSSSTTTSTSGLAWLAEVAADVVESDTELRLDLSIPPLVVKEEHLVERHAQRLRELLKVANLGTWVDLEQVFGC